MHLEKQELGAIPVLLAYEKDRDLEVSHSCSTIRKRIYTNFIHNWCNNRKFHALGYGKLTQENFFPDQSPYFEQAIMLYKHENNNDCFFYHRHATRLWAIERLMAGESFHKIEEELVGDDMLSEEHYHHYHGD
ncbi:hypothetical protein C4577_03070 [Candidatus Parcubacteria bacterium]|nr:MAG: hypothetical protein C4577_03070 [Candidatus Parcubacteria bacterium]